MKQIKKIPKKDVDQFIKIAGDAYPGINIHTSEDRKRVKTRISKRFDCKNTTFYGVYDKNELLAGIVFYDFTMNLFGHKVKAGGGGFLAVSLLHKKEHLARDICRYFFQWYRKHKAPFTLLWPFRPDFYRQMGVGHGTKDSVYRFKPSQIPRCTSKSNLRELKKSDIKKVISCFNRFADKHHGMLYDLDDYRRFHFSPGETMRCLGYEKKGRLDGYMLFTFIKGKLPHFLDNEIRISELIYNSPEAFMAMMHYLQTQADQIPIINFITSDENFHHFLIDPRNDSGMMHPAVHHETNLQATGAMYRSVNNKLIFEILKDHSFNNQSLRLKLTVNDTFLKENDGSFVVNFKDGYPKVMKAASNYDVALELDNADFSSLILGAVDLKSLYTYGRVKLSKETYLDQLHTLFRTEQKPMCLTDF